MSVLNAEKFIENWYGTTISKGWCNDYEPLQNLSITELKQMLNEFAKQKANEANKQPDTEALRLQDVVSSTLEDKLKEERISLMRDLISDFEGGWDSDEYVRMLKERIDIEINGI